MSKTAIPLENNPIERDYEDYIAAYFQSGGLYVERSIIHREEIELLELDLILTLFDKSEVATKLVEVKSKSWGFSEIFKVRGWLTYLKMETGMFIVKESRERFDDYQRKAETLGVTLINNSDLEQTDTILSSFLSRDVDFDEIRTLRYAYLIERAFIKEIKNGKKLKPELEFYKKLDKYFDEVNNASFFSPNPLKRIAHLFKTYVEFKNITAKVAWEDTHGEYKDDVNSLPEEAYRKVFFQAEQSPIHIAMYIEHIARLAILKSCTLHIIERKTEDVHVQFKDIFDWVDIPSTIRNGLAEISQEPYFHRYPIFWQLFTYVMGGFILRDLREAEFEYMSKRTGIPIDSIPDALKCFNKLFPKDGGWKTTNYKANIDCHRFFPLPLSGLGANHRRFIHIESTGDVNEDYERIEALVSGSNTVKDLRKWHNLGYHVLSTISPPK